MAAGDGRRGSGVGSLSSSVARTCKDTHPVSCATTACRVQERERSPRAATKPQREPPENRSKTQSRCGCSASWCLCLFRRSSAHNSSVIRKSETCDRGDRGLTRGLRARGMAVAKRRDANTEKGDPSHWQLKPTIATNGKCHFGVNARLLTRPKRRPFLQEMTR